VYTKPLFFISILLLLQRVPNVHQTVLWPKKNIQNLEFIPEDWHHFMESVLKTRTVYSLKIGMSIINSWWFYWEIEMPNIKAGANRYKTKGATDSQSPQGML
jgi:hypothetical protein